jgi:hypothetical protein
MRCVPSGAGTWRRWCPASSCLRGVFARHVPASQPGLFLLVAAALFVAVIVLNRRGAAQLQRQIDALDAMADATVTR